MTPEERELIVVRAAEAGRFREVTGWWIGAGTRALRRGYVEHVEATGRVAAEVEEVLGEKVESDEELGRLVCWALNAYRTRGVSPSYASEVAAWRAGAVE